MDNSGRSSNIKSEAGRGGVCLLYASTGSGHKNASEAIRLSIAERDPGLEIIVFDILDFMPGFLARIYSRGYLLAASRFPLLWHLIYERSSDLSDYRGPGFLHTAFWKPVFGRLFDLLRRMKPGHIVSTHFLSSWVAGQHKIKCDPDCRVATVITDYGVHPVWVEPGQDIVFVASQQLKAELEPFADYFGTDRFEVVGIPIHSRYTENKDVELLRKKFDLDPERVSILILRDVCGSKNVNRILSSLAGCRAPLELMLAGGTIESAPENLKRMLEGNNKRLQVFGYVDFLDEIMAVSDLAISKPGGLISSECLASGLPLVIYKPYPGQEERNCNYLLEEGVAVRVEQVSGFRHKIETLINGPGPLERMKSNALRIAKPRAAAKIAEILFE
jgi:processive 1,2-diacylglycerol beta-glucosyltransferase